MRVLAVLLVPFVLAACQAQQGEAPGGQAAVPAMITPLPDSGFDVRVLFTVGDRIDEYQPPGVLDGTGAWRQPGGTVRVLVNHELGSRRGYPYRLANGTTLRGARVSFFDLDPETLAIVDAGLAYDEIRDRDGRIVTQPAQVSEREDAPEAGLNALCSAQAYAGGEAGLVDDILFTHEEVSALEDHPHGGSIWALDVRERRLWALPDLGRGAWENVTAVAAPPGYVALLLSDDIQIGRAPLYLYLGRPDPAGDFPARNGLRGGQLFVWVSAQGDRSAADWNGTGARRDGRFVPVAARDPTRAGEPGHDASGYLDDTTLREAAWQLGAYSFSRPEDLHTRPGDRSQVVFTSTGHGAKVPDDDWGGIYRIALRFETAADGTPQPAAALTILHDTDDFGDRGIRSPDNLTWARDGMVYVQEDKATKRARFGAETGTEASIWRLDPDRPDDYQRIAVIDRSVRVPPGVRDRKSWQFGAWETSGIIDISDQLNWAPPRLALLLTVQAHGLRGGVVGGREQLVEGGQLLLLIRE